MKKFMTFLVVFAVLLTALAASASVAAQEEPAMGPAEVVQAIYAAVSAGDVDAAVELLAEEAVLTLIPPPGDLDGTFIGKEEIGDWYTGLVADNGRAEFSDVYVAGNMANMKLTWYGDHFSNLGVGPAEFDGAAVVQDGLLKSVSWVETPEFTAKVAAAMERQADAALVERILTEIWSEGNLDLIDELVAEDYVSHTWPIGEGRDHFRQDVLSWRADFPDTVIVVDRMVFDGPRAIIFSQYVPADASPENSQPDDDIDDILVYQLEDGRLSDRWYFAPFDPTQ
jgi:ketosteroid isomerase-like protein